MTKTKCGTLALVLVVSSFVGLRAYAFKVISKRGHEVRWKSMPVKYYLYEGGPKSFSKGDFDGKGKKVSLEKIVEQAFATWKGTEDIDIDYSYEGKVTERISGDDGKNVISFIKDGWASLEFEPPAGALAVTITTYDTGSGNLVDTDIYFNDDYYDWGHIDTDEEAKGYVVDIQNIATHEIGHLFGLDHPSESPYETKEQFRSATMYYSSSAGDVSRRSLNEDDQSAIKHLYPSEEFDRKIPVPEVTEMSPSYASNTGMEIKVTVTGDYFGPLTMIKLTRSDMGEDAVCKVLSYSKDQAECVFDLFGAPRGEYDLVVANTYEKEAVLKDAFAVYERSMEEVETPAPSSGGCGRIDGPRPNGSQALFGIILLIFPIGIFALRKRELCLELKRTKYVS